MRKLKLIKIYFLLKILLLYGCSNLNETSTVGESKTSKVDSEQNSQKSTNIIENFDEDTTNYNYATYFIVVADTSNNYYLLHNKMFELNKKLNIPIDTMGRYYNVQKDLIVLPDNDEDEIYAGDYFPRRFPSQNLSLEYLDLYLKLAGDKTIALVTGIYETEKNADSAVSVLQKTNSKAFKTKAKMFVGCMH